MREALYFRNKSFSAKLDSEADVSKYGQIQPHIRRPYPAGAGYRWIRKNDRISAGAGAEYDIRCNPTICIRKTVQARVVPTQIQSCLS